MRILDTNVISELFRSRPAEPVTQWFYEQEPQDLYVTAISKAESLTGLALMPFGRRRQALEVAIRTFYDQRLLTEILPFSSGEADHFAKIVAARRASGRAIGEFDAQIAAIARSYGYAVVTRNTRDFADCGVDVINPWEPS